MTTSENKINLTAQEARKITESKDYLSVTVAIKESAKQGHSEVQIKDDLRHTIPELKKMGYTVINEGRTDYFTVKW